MTFKTITIREDTYRRLLAVKREDESFSDLFDRLVSGSVGTLKALRGSVEFEAKDEMLREMRKKREEVRYV
jgi:predicted CopG family antitoxin